jgi:group I intron endonuclease
MTYGIIYKATNTANGKVYIGLTTETLKERKRKHQYRAYKGDKRETFQIALLDEGFDNFQWEQIDSAESEAELSEKEQYWVSFYKADDPAHGYNIQGGGIGAKHTAETKRKLSEMQKGDKNYWYGKHLSAEHRRKQSEALRNPSPETRRRHSESLKGKNTWSKGQVPWNKGKTASEETRQKMREAHKRRREKIENT